MMFRCYCGRGLCVCVSPCPLRFAQGPLNVIDLVSILPFYFELISKVEGVRRLPRSIASRPGAIRWL